MKIKNTSVAESLYWFFAAFEGFDASHPLGFETELPPPREFCKSGYHIQLRGRTVECPAVFSMNPTLKVVRRYIHGVRILRGTCSISFRLINDDTARNRKTMEFLSALGTYISEHGEGHTNGDQVFMIRPDTHPVRLHQTPDGMVWEMRCTVEMREPKVKGD